MHTRFCALSTVPASKSGLETGYYMFKRFMLVAVAAMSFCAPAFSQDLPSFEFRGHVIGEDAAAAFPDYQKADIQPDCIAGLLPTEYSCTDGTLEGAGADKKLGSIKVNNLSWKIFDGKVVGFEIGFHSAYYPDLKNMLIGKYGEPQRTALSDFAGLDFPNAIDEWDFKQGNLKLKMYSANRRIQYGSLRFTSPDVVAKMEKIKVDAQKADGKAAF